MGKVVYLEVIAEGPRNPSVPNYLLQQPVSSVPIWPLWVLSEIRKSITTIRTSNTHQVVKMLIRLSETSFELKKVHVHKENFMQR